MNDYHRNSLQYLQEHPEIATTPAGMALGYLLFKNISGTLGGGAVGYGAGRLASSDSEPTLRRKTDENLAEIKSVAPRLRAAATSQTGPAPAVPGVSDISDRAALKTRVDALLNDAAKPVGTGTADTVARSMKMLAEAKALAAAVDAQQRKLQVARAAVGDKTPVPDMLQEHAPLNPTVDKATLAGAWETPWGWYGTGAAASPLLGVAAKKIGKTNVARFDTAASLLGEAGTDAAAQVRKDLLRLVRSPQELDAYLQGNTGVASNLSAETRTEIEDLLKKLNANYRHGAISGLNRAGDLQTHGVVGSGWNMLVNRLLPWVRQNKGKAAGRAGIAAALAGAAYAGATEMGTH